MLDANVFAPLLDEAPDALDDDPWLASLGVPESG